MSDLNSLVAFIFGHVFNLFADLVGISQLIHDPTLLYLIDKGFKLLDGASQKSTEEVGDKAIICV